MFRISRKLDYGLQLMICLASAEGSAPQSTASLAEKLQMPLPFLHQIGHGLMQAGLVKASPGPRGGLRLNQPAENITILMIVETLEGPLSLNPCLDCEDCCPRQTVCPAQFFWADVQSKISDHLNSVTLSELCTHPESISMYSAPFNKESKSKEIPQQIVNK
jgi:Rrf2 family protein